MTKLTTERLDKLQDDLLQFQDSYSDPADKENYDIFVDALHVLDEFKAAKEQLLAYEQAAKNPVAWVATDSEDFPEYNSHNEFSADCGAGTPLYAAPVLPKQPEFYTKPDRFLPESLKPEEISGERRNSRIAELMGWFDRYYSGKANPKWLKSHVAELCYYILTVPQLSAQPVSEPYKLPSGYALVPCKLTAENGAKSCMIGEFTEQTEISCPECFGDDECETWDGSGMIEVTVPVSWTTIKDIWAKGIEHFAAAPAQEQK